MWGAPQSGFSRLSMRINSRTSFAPPGRPGLPCRIFQRQNKPKPVRCQPITVAGWMMKTRASQSFPDRTEPGPEKAVSSGELGALDGALEHADLMAQGEDL